MTTVEVVFRFATPLSESVTFALANTREVYGIRGLKLDRTAQTLRVEYDATRLNTATVTRLVCQAGLRLLPEDLEALEAPPSAVPEAAPAA